MLKLLRQLALALLAFAWLTAPAQADWITKTGKPEKTVKEPRAPKPLPVTIAKPAMWVVSDADTTIYLFGTIHVLPERISWMRGKVEDAFKSSDLLVTEIPDADPSAIQNIVMRTAMLPERETLHGQLSKEDQVLLDAVLKDYGLAPAVFDRYEPWFAAIGIANLPIAREKYSAANGVEAQLGAKSKSMGQVRDALETPEYQLAIFDRLPRKVQVKYLHEVMTSLPKMHGELQQLIKYWSTGNVDKLAALINEDEQIPEMAQALIYNRNQAWAEWIRRRLSKPGKVFVAVGAGHLAGAGSVQAYLAKMKIAAPRVQ